MTIILLVTSQQKNIGDCEMTHSVNPFYLIIGKVNGYIEENGNKYLIFASTDKKKEILTKYTKFCDEIKNLIECNSIETIDNKPG